VSKASHSIPPDLFPTSNTCESCVSFTDEGEVLPTDPKYNSAIENVLNLNADKLMRKRKPKIQPFANLDFSPEEAQKIIKKLETPDSEGKLDPYCGAVIGYIRTNYPLLP